MGEATPETHESVIERSLVELARDHSGRVIALLARRFSDLDVVDEAVQDALVDAARTWPDNGVPDNPAAWLLTVARRRAIDRLRSADSARRRIEGSAPELVVDPNEPGAADDLVIDDPRVDDDRLRMVLLCCHPALSTASQVALTLRLVGGLTTEEIAAALLVPTSTLAQRVSRAKGKIRTANIALAVPADLTERLDAVLAVLYLIFNEGYLSRSGAEGPSRVDLCGEAIRLTVQLSMLLPDQAEVKGLLALELFVHARRDARLSPNAELVLLEDQDRSRWDASEISTANGEMMAALALMAPGRFQLQALIASLHSNARTAADTDWPKIVGLYEQLVAMDPSPVVALNHAVAVAMADGPLRGLSMLHQIDGLADYHLFHAAVGELERRAGSPERSSLAFLRAIELVNNPAERQLLERRLSDVTR